MNIEGKIAAIIADAYESKWAEDWKSQRVAEEIVSLPEFIALLNCWNWTTNAVPRSLYGVDVTTSYKVGVFDALRDLIYAPKPPAGT